MTPAKLIDRPVLRYHPDTSKAADIIIIALGDDPVVLWIDEPNESCIELLRVLSLQPENRDRVFVIATTSRPSTLPAPLEHSTCFDRIFHIDLPDLQGRAFLWDCLIERIGGDQRTVERACGALTGHLHCSCSWSCRDGPTQT